VKWSQRLRQTGSAAAKPQGRRQSRRLAPHQDWILGRLAEEKDLTMRALVIELGARGIATSEVSVWRLVRDARFSFKKNTVRGRAGSARRGPQAPVLEEVPGQAGA
jgi:transposase